MSTLETKTLPHTIMMPPLDGDFDEGVLFSAAEAYDAFLRTGESITSDFSEKHWDLASVFQLLNDVFAVEAITGSEPELPESEKSCPDRVGRFQIRSEVGRGGFAIVYRAFDELLKREVAVKVIIGTSRHRVGSPENRLSEARAAARLSHPNIVPVYEVHAQPDSVYIVSEFCDGPTLGDWLCRHPGHVAVDVTVEIVGQIADAVAHAHARGLIHRDIKPGNVLLQPSDHRDTRIGYTPQLTDFGLAIDLADVSDGSTTRSFASDLAGTLEYMAPELIRGLQTGPNPACDVYSLGALLYLMLTGQLPHQGSTTVALMKSICTSPIDRPRSIRPMIPIDIEAICMKCLAKDPPQRYADASGLVDDLNRWKRGQSVSARTQSKTEQAFQMIRKHPIESALLSAFLVVSISAVLILANLNRRLSLRDDALRVTLADAQAQRQLAEKNREDAIRVAYRADVIHGFDAYGKGQIAEAQRTINSIYQYTKDLAPLGTDLRILQSLSAQRSVPMKPPVGDLNSIIVIPQQNNLVATASDDEMIRFYRGDRGEFLHQHVVAEGAKVSALAVSTDGSLLAIGYRARRIGNDVLVDNVVVIVRWQDWQVVHTFHGYPTTVASIAFSPAQDRIAVGCRYQNIIVESLIDPLDQVTIPSDRRNEELFFTNDGKALLAYNSIKTVRLLDSRSGNVLQELKLDYQPHHIALSSDNRWIAISDFHGPNIRIYQRDDMRKTGVILTQNHGITDCIRFSQSGNRFVAGLRSGGIVCWELQEVNPVNDLVESEAILSPSVHLIPMSETVESIVFVSEEAMICGGNNGEIVWCDLSRHQADLHPLDDYATHTAVLTSDGSTIYAGSDDGRLLKFDLQTQQVSTFIDPAIENDPNRLQSPLRRLALAANGSRLGVGWDDGSVACIELPSGAVRFWKNSAELPEDTRHSVSAIAFDTASTQMLVVRGVDRAELIDCEQLESKSTHSILERRARAVAFIPEQAGFVYGGLSEDLRQIAFDGRFETLFLSKCEQVTSILYDPTGRRALCGDSSGRIRIHDRNGNLANVCGPVPERLSLDTGTMDVTALTFSPDQRNLLSGNQNGEVRIWDAADLTFLGTIHPPDGRGMISNIHFSSDGRVLMYHQVIADTTRHRRIHLLKLSLHDDQPRRNDVRF